MNGSGWKALKQIRDCKDYIKYLRKNQDKLVLTLDERDMVEGWLDIANDVQGDLTYDVCTLEAVHAEILNMSKRFPKEMDEDEDNSDPWGSDDSKGVGSNSKDNLEPEEMIRNPHFQTPKKEEQLDDKGPTANTPPPTHGRGTTSGIRVGVQNTGVQKPYFGRGRGVSASNGHVNPPGPGPVPTTHNQPGTYNPPNAATPQPMNGAYRIPPPQPFSGHPQQMYNVPFHPQPQPLNGHAYNAPLHSQSPNLNGHAYNVPLHPQSQPLNVHAYNVPLHSQSPTLNGQAYNQHMQYNFPHHPQPNYQQSFPTATYIPAGASGHGTQINPTRQFVYNNQVPSQAPAPAPEDPRLNSQNRPGQPYYPPRMDPNGMPCPTMQQQPFFNSSHRSHVMSPSPPMPNYPEYEPDFVPEPQPSRTSYSTQSLNTPQSNQGQPQRTTYRLPTYQNFAANRHNPSGGKSFRPNGQLGKFGKPNGNPQFRRLQNSSRPSSSNNNFGSNNNGSSNPARNGQRPTTSSTQQTTVRRKIPSSSAVRAQDDAMESNSVEDMNGANDSDENSAGERERILLKKNCRAFDNLTEWRKSLVEQNTMYRLGTKSKNNVVEVSQEEMAQPAENLQPGPAKKTTKNKKATARKTTKNSSTSTRKPVKVPAKRATKSKEDEDDDGESADDFQPEKRGSVKIKLPFNNNNNKKPARPKSKETGEPIAHCSNTTSASRAQAASSKPKKTKSKAATNPSSSQPKSSPGKRSIKRPQIIYSDEEEEIEQYLEASRILLASEQLEQVRPIQIQESSMYKLEDILPYIKILVLEFRKAKSLEGASKFLAKPTNFQRFLTAVIELLDEAIEPELMLGQGVPAELCVRAERPEGRVLRARCIPKELKLTPTFVKFLESVYQDSWLPRVASARIQETEPSSSSQRSRKRDGSVAKDDAKKAKKVDQKSTANNPDASNGSSKDGSTEDDMNGSQEPLGNGAVKKESEEYDIPENIFAGSGIDTVPATATAPTNAPLTTPIPQETTASVHVEVKTEIKMELDDSDYDELPAEVLENLNLVPDVL